MASEEITTAAMILRIAEFGSWMPLHDDPATPQLKAVSGDVGVEIIQGERLVDIEILPTQQIRHLPIPANGNEPARNQAVKLMIFRATFARVAPGPIPKEPRTPGDVASRLQMPPGYKEGQ